MSKELLKNMIELVPEDDIETIYKVVLKFIPEDTPELDEIKAIKDAKDDETFSESALNW